MSGEVVIEEERPKTTMKIRRVGDEIILTMPVEEVQSLRVALQECPCRATKSHGTMAIRKRLVRGLGMAIYPFRKTSTQETTS